MVISVDEMKRFMMTLPEDLYNKLLIEMESRGLDSIQSTIRHIIASQKSDPVEVIKGKVYSENFGQYGETLLIGRPETKDEAGIGFRFGGIFKKYENQWIELRIYPWNSEK